MANSLIASTLPLSGKTILVTRSLGQSSQFSASLEASGANVIEMPTIEICPPSSWDALDRGISEISKFNWLILTSTNGVDYFLERLMAYGKDTRALAHLKIAVVGEKTANHLKQRSLLADFIPPNFVADSLIENFPEDLQGKKILFPTVESGARDVIEKQFTAKGAEVLKVAAYQSSCPKSIPPIAELALKSGEVDVVTFASSKTAQFFYQLASTVLPEEKVTNHLQKICVASIGPQTSKTCNELFGRVDVEAEEYTLDGLTQAIVKWSRGNRE